MKNNKDIDNLVEKEHKKAKSSDKKAKKVEKTDKKAKPSKVDKGHMVSVDYVGTLDNGEEFDNSKNNGPISFVVGNGQVIKGFDEAVLGMKVGDSKKFKVPSNEAYGDVNPELMHKVPLDKLPEDIKKQVKIGGFLVMQAPTGQQIPAKVKSIDSKEIVLDLNHPLAGKDLTFNIKIVDISHPEKHEHECACGKDGCGDEGCGGDGCGGNCNC